MIDTTNLLKDMLRHYRLSQWQAAIEKAQELLAALDNNEKPPKGYKKSEAQEVAQHVFAASKIALEG